MRLTDGDIKTGSILAAGLMALLGMGLTSAPGPALATGQQSAGADARSPVRAETSPATTGGPIDPQDIERHPAENACYVRLADLPAGRYGGFGAFNWDSGVAVYAGGAEKRTSENTITYHDMYAIRLDGEASAWTTVAYGSNGYTREADKGCRQMATVSLSAGRWVSAFGKDGCDNGRFDSSRKGGDIKELRVGETPTRQDVRWVPNTGAASLPRLLVDEEGKLTDPFAGYDPVADRLIIGHGTFDSAKISETGSAVYEATRAGSQWRVRELRPEGPIPERRSGSCGAMVHDPDLGLNGVVVIGGESAGRHGEALAEVWYLDLTDQRDGTWTDLTPRFANMDAFGPRREGACAFDANGGHVYSWMGRASKDIEDGSKRSSGAWRFDARRLAGSGVLTWERLARDDFEPVRGRRQIPSVWDPANRRMLVMGGRNDDDEYRDVWAIYPDIGPAECEALDPYASYRRPAPQIPTPAPTAPRPGDGDSLVATACPRLGARVAPATVAVALADPSRVAGWGLARNPGLPVGPQNPPRTYLALSDWGKLYHPVFNPLVFRVGCQ